MAEITWHRGYDFELNDKLTRSEGVHHARKDGECIATAEVREGTPAGYWGRYTYTVHGTKGRQYATTLSEIKAIVNDKHGETK
jgi:hypothetical protein